MKSSNRANPRFTIGDLAEQFGLATHVLRHWESQGLLTPERTASGHRRYGKADQYRVSAILHAKEAGLPLDQIRTMVTSTDPTTRSQALRRQRDELTRRINDAQTSLALIEAALECRHGDLATCPHFQSLLDQHMSGHTDPAALTNELPRRERP